MESQNLLQFEDFINGNFKIEEKFGNQFLVKTKMDTKS